MSFVDDFNRAVGYIEDHLTTEFDLDEAAHLAKCSAYHFQRVFSSITGIPVAEYVRRRRMTLAAFEIQNSEVRILDLALKYGYDTHSSFTRAFQSVQGITPSKARVDGVQLVAYPPLVFQFILRGVEAMQYRIVETQPFRVFGLDAVKTDGWTGEDYLKNGDRVVMNGSHDAINVAAGFPGQAREMIENKEWDVTKVHVLNAITFWDENGNRFMMYGWEEPETGVDERFTVFDIPAAKWVVVTAQLDGDRSIISRCYTDLYVNWFPTSGYEQAPGCPVIEKYDQTRAELWMPIISK